MKRKTNKTKEEAWSQTAHAPDGEQPGPEASDTSGQSVPKSKFRKKSQQEQAAVAKLRMESQGEKLEQAREKLAIQELYRRQPYDQRKKYYLRETNRTCKRVH